MRAKWMADLREHIRASGMAQTEVAERLGMQLLDLAQVDHDLGAWVS